MQEFFSIFTQKTGRTFVRPAESRFIPNRVWGTLVGTTLAAIMDIGVVCSIVSQTAFGCADNSTRICNLIKLVPLGTNS